MKKKTSRAQFITKLHNMLTKENGKIIRWTADGTAFLILKPLLFVKDQGGRSRASSRSMRKNSEMSDAMPQRKRFRRKSDSFGRRHHVCICVRVGQMCGRMCGRMCAVSHAGHEQLEGISTRHTERMDRSEEEEEGERQGPTSLFVRRCFLWLLVCAGISSAPVP